MKCTIHIGQQKTGSTFLQAYMNQSREHLLNQGYLYPLSLGNKKQNKLLSDYNNLTDHQSDVYKNFEKEISKTTAEHTICSEENLFLIPKEAISTIHKFLSNFFDQFEIIVYLRRQDDHFLSIYQQNVRGKTTDTIKELLNSDSYLDKYSYNQILTNWKSVFSNAPITVRPYGHLLNNDIIDDFFNVLHISKKDKPVENNFAITNKSFDAESIELIRQFNILEKEGSLVLPHKKKRQLRVYLKNKPRSDKFSLNVNDKKKIWKTFLKENKALCANFDLGGHESYFLAEPPESSKKPLYNRHIHNDQLYDLFFDVFGT